MLRSAKVDAAREEPDKMLCRNCLDREMLRAACGYRCTWCVIVRCRFTESMLK